MEHLPRLRSPRIPPIEVPFLGGAVPSTRGDFLNYPASLGWDTVLLTEGLNLGSYLTLFRALKDNSLFRPTMIATLLQQWWYFGMLSEVLGSSVRIDDFTKENSQGLCVVTTEKLGTSVQDWRKRLALLPQELARKQLEHAMRCVTYVHKNLETLSNRIEHHHQNPTLQTQTEQYRSPLKGHIGRAANGGIFVSDEGLRIISMFGTNEPPQAVSNTGYVNFPLEALQLSEEDSWKIHGRKMLPEELELSICVLGFTLSHAIKHLFQQLDLDSGTDSSIKHSGWYCPPFINRSMIAGGACRRAIHRLRPTMLIIGGYLSNQLQWHKSEPSHEVCTEVICTSDYMVDTEYSRSHSVEGCLCTDIEDNSVSERVQAVLKGGQIPILRVLDSSSECPIVEVLPVVPTRKYVAFSHVWSDGLGNPDSNTLYKCQYQRLQHLADNIFPSDYQKEYRFFWLDTVCVPRADVNLEARQLAISRMRQTYFGASEVLVLDSHLSCLSSEISNLEFLLRLAWSKWMRRLWTMHEGAMATPGRTFIQLKDGTIRLLQVYKDMMETIQQDDLNENESVFNGLGAVEPTTACFNCVEIRERVGQQMFIFAWNESKNRGTKYDADRYVVVCSLLGLQSHLTLKMKDTQEKMKFLFNGVPEIPAMILFTTGPKIQEDNWRWAPASLEKRGRIDSLPPLPPAKLHNRGLLVCFTGWHLFSHPDWNSRFKWTGHWTEPVDRSTVPSGRCAWAVELLNSEKVPEFYSVNFADGDHINPSLSPTASLAVILQPRFHKHGKWLQAALVSVREEKDGILFARFEARLIVTEVASDEIALLRKVVGQGYAKLIKADKVGENDEGQQWCIG